MKQTGLIQRVGTNGRFAIPARIRRKLTIRDGETMEIFVDKDSIVLKKFSGVEELTSFNQKICSILNNITDYDIIITDRIRVITALDQNLKPLEFKRVSNRLLEVINKRETISSIESILITDEIELTGNITIVPIITSENCAGLVIIRNKTENSSEMETMARFISQLISFQIDI